MNVVITGSSRGLGLELAKEFLRQGHSVMCHGRNREQLGILYNKLHGEFPESLIHIYACDVTCYNSMDRMFWEANRFFGSVDIWINNAAIRHIVNPVYENRTSPNLTGVDYGTSIAFEKMKKRGGAIYNAERPRVKGQMDPTPQFIKSLIKDNTQANIIIGRLILSDYSLDKIVSKIVKNKKNGALIKAPLTPKNILRKLGVIKH